MVQSAKFVQDLETAQSFNEIDSQIEAVRDAKDWKWFKDVIVACHKQMISTACTNDVLWAHAVFKCMEILVAREMPIYSSVDEAIVDAISRLKGDCESLRKYLLPLVDYILKDKKHMESSRRNLVLTPWSSTSTPDPNLLNLCVAPKEQIYSHSFRFQLLKVLSAWCIAVMRDKTAVDNNLKRLLFIRTFENLNMAIPKVYEPKYILEDFSGIEEAMVDYSIDMLQEDPEACNIFEPLMKKLFTNIHYISRFLKAITLEKLRVIGNASPLGSIIKRLIKSAQYWDGSSECFWITALGKIYGGSMDIFPITEIFLDRIVKADDEERGNLASLCANTLKHLRLDEIDRSIMKVFLSENYSRNFLLKLIYQNLEYIEGLGLFDWLKDWTLKSNPDPQSSLYYAAIFFIDRFSDVSPFMKFLEHFFQNQENFMPVPFLIEFLKNKFSLVSDQVLEAAMLNKNLILHFSHEFIGNVKYESRIAGLLMRCDKAFVMRRHGRDVTDWLRRNLRVCAQDTLEERVRKLIITGQYSKLDLFLFFATSKDTELRTNVADLLRGEDFSVEPEYCAKRNVSLESLMNVAKYQQDLKNDGTEFGTRSASLSPVQWITDVPLELLRAEPVALDIILSEFFKACVYDNILPDFEDEWLSDFSQILRATYFAIDQVEENSK